MMGRGGAPEGKDVANLFTSQLSAALQFDMAEVFHMTTEGIRGRIMMLGHAKAQGFAPPDADRLLMFLNLELKERAAGREIAVKVLEEELESKATTAAPTPRDSPTPRKEPSQHPAKSVPAAASAVPAPSFSGPSASKPSSSSAPASAIASSSAAREANDRPPAASRAVEPEGSNGGGGGGGGGASSSSLKKSSVAGANIGSGKVLRDKPWNPKPKVKSEAFSIGAGGKMEVCFMTSAGNNTNNRQKPKKKADKEKEEKAKAEAEKERQREKKEKEKERKQETAAQQQEREKEERKKALKRIAEHKQRQQQQQQKEEELRSGGGRVRRAASKSDLANPPGRAAASTQSPRVVVKTQSSGDVKAASSEAETSRAATIAGVLAGVQVQGNVGDVGVAATAAGWASRGGGYFGENLAAASGRVNSEAGGGDERSENDDLDDDDDQDEDDDEDGEACPAGEDEMNDMMAALGGGGAVAKSRGSDVPRAAHTADGEDQGGYGRGVEEGAVAGSAPGVEKRVGQGLSEPSRGQSAGGSGQETGDDGVVKREVSEGNEVALRDDHSEEEEEEDDDDDEGIAASVVAGVEDQSAVAEQPRAKGGKRQEEEEEEERNNAGAIEADSSAVVPLGHGGRVAQRGAKDGQQIALLGEEAAGDGGDVLDARGGAPVVVDDDDDDDDGGDIVGELRGDERGKGDEKGQGRSSVEVEDGGGGDEDKGGDAEWKSRVGAETKMAIEQLQALAFSDDDDDDDYYDDNDDDDGVGGDSKLSGVSSAPEQTTDDAKAALQSLSLSKGGRTELEEEVARPSPPLPHPEGDRLDSLPAKPSPAVLVAASAKPMASAGSVTPSASKPLAASAAAAAVKASPGKVGVKPGSARSQALPNDGDKDKDKDKDSPLVVHPAFSAVKSAEQLFAALCGEKEEHPERFASLAGRMIRDWDDLRSVFERWTRVSDENSCSDNLDSSALRAAALRQQKRTGGGSGGEEYSSKRIFKVVQSRQEVASIVTDAFSKVTQMDDTSQGWIEMPATHKDSYAWNLLWTWSKPKIKWDELNVWQRVNHFQEAKQMTRKDYLKKNIMRFRNIPGKVGDAFDILPMTFTLPGDYVQFCTEFAKRYDSDSQRNYWIMKPAGSSRGRGIFVFNDISAVSYTEVVIVQRYVDRPLLLDGYKFDLRLYVLVTNMHPLEAFIYKKGFGRLSSEVYSTDPKDMTNRYVHLTNSSINRHNVNNVQRLAIRNDKQLEGGSKISLDYLWKRLTADGIDTNMVWNQIVEVVLKTLYCVQDNMPSSPNSFELFGFDVLIDQDLKPWLIEVNASPSLSRENELDHAIKNTCIQDTIRLVDAPAFDRKIICEVLNKKLGEKAKSRWHTDKELASQLHKALGGVPPRQVGEMPRYLGGYERCAPGPQWDAVCKLHKKVNSGSKH